MAFASAAGCSTPPCPIIQGIYTVGGTCAGADRCPLTQSGCGGTLVCSTSGLACTGEVTTQGTATFSCGGPSGQGTCSGARGSSGIIDLTCQIPGTGSCTLTLTPVADAG